MPDLIDRLSALSTFAISVACAVHIVFFIFLWTWARRDLKTIASSLADFTRELRNRSILDATSHLSDQIEAFLADIREVLSDPSRKRERESLLQRISILDEKRKYLHSVFFETCYNLGRTMIEAYPLAGILGTILAIGAALQMDNAEAATGVSVIVRKFGDAIWSTFAGLSAAILLMFLNSLMEPTFGRLSENRVHVRDVIARAKRELSMNAAGEET